MPQKVCNALCQWCLWEVGKWADRNNFNGKIAYFFEAGNAEESETQRNLEKIQFDSFIKQRCRYGSHSFIGKRERTGLQAADTLAWFNRREAEDDERVRVGTARRDRRKDFQALIGLTEAELGVIEHRFLHFTPDSLQDFFRENSLPETRWYS